jgi:hypothetical protein
MNTPRLSLQIGRMTYLVMTVEDARDLYVRMRDASGKGASEFPVGKISGHPSGPITIAYNGRLFADIKTLTPFLGA